MKTITTIASALLVLAGAAHAAPAAPAAAPASATAPTYYYWLHPKLGMVKVDRDTNAMITGKQARTEARTSN